MNIRLPLVVLGLGFSSLLMAQQPSQPIHNKAPNIQPCTYDNSCTNSDTKSTSRKVNANGNKKDNQTSTSRKVNANGDKRDRDTSTSRKVNANTPQ